MDYWKRKTYSRIILFNRKQISFNLDSSIFYSQEELSIYSPALISIGDIKAGAADLEHILGPFSFITSRQDKTEGFPFWLFCLSERSYFFFLDMMTTVLLTIESVCFWFFFLKYVWRYYFDIFLSSSSYYFILYFTIYICVFFLLSFHLLKPTIYLIVFQMGWENIVVLICCCKGCKKIGWSSFMSLTRRVLIINRGDDRWIKEGGRGKEGG